MAALGAFSKVRDREPEVWDALVLSQPEGAELRGPGRKEREGGPGPGWAGKFGLGVGPLQVGSGVSSGMKPADFSWSHRGDPLGRRGWGEPGASHVCKVLGGGAALGGLRARRLQRPGKSRDSGRGD